MQTQRHSISLATLSAAGLKTLPAKNAPIALSASELKQVSGGAPKGTWSVASDYLAPKGSW